MTGAREMARVRTVGEIKRLALQQLADEGTGGLSLRAIARDLGMVSSAIYRYFPGRDELLTALIVDAYEDLGSVGEEADRARRPDAIADRWMTLCRAARAWAHVQPARYALIYGSPVPGYQAPADTIGPASRFTTVLVGLLAHGVAIGVVEPDSGRSLSRAVRNDVRALMDRAGVDLPAGTMVRGMSAWIHLFGCISWELFGHLHNVVDDTDAWFEQQMREQARAIGVVGA
jgi:AcrR family transcriptional regulator